jgi:trimeric autotransporter adhesin
VTDVTTTRTSQAAYNQPSANVTGTSYLSVNVATATATPSGVGASRTTQTLNGFVGGVVQQVDSSGANLTTRTMTTSDPTALVLNTSATNNRASADITVANWGTSGGNPVSATFHLGGTTGGNDASSSFIDDNTYAVRDRTAAVGNTTTVGGSSSTVTSSTTLVSYATAPTPTLFSNASVTACTCSFLTWGWWGGNVNYSNTSGYAPGSADRMNFATYVAGTLSTASTINALSSTATYNGQMVGNVVNGANSYVQAGSYQNVWSFGSQNGVVTANFDGTSFGGGVTANTFKTGDVTFGTSSGGITAGGKTLTLNGAFFSSASNGSNAAGQAGSFAITGSAYKAGGTFAAQK